MNQNISAAETLFSAAHPYIKKITNISALILSLLFCAVGLCLLFFSSKVEDSSSASGPVPVSYTHLTLPTIYSV